MAEKCATTPVGLLEEPYQTFQSATGEKEREVWRLGQKMAKVSGKEAGRAFPIPPFLPIRQFTDTYKRPLNSSDLRRKGKT